MTARTHDEARRGRGRMAVALAAALLLLPAAWASAAPAETSDTANPEDATPEEATPEPPTSEPEASAQPTAEPTADPEAASPAVAPPEPTVPIEGPALLDGVLPCGVRVVVARDTTLPVAAVVLAVETGTEDDPKNQPGLVHALAYQLLQGNRELSPGAAAAIAHDGGGVTTLGIGPAQVRYESLVPASRLPAALWAEAQRLRAPTVSEVLWADSLRWARRDKARKWGAPRTALAAAHRAPGFEHAGRKVTTELTSMAPPAIAAAIAQRFRYTRATLTVVAPGELSETWDEVAKAFAYLPDATRQLPSRLTTPATIPSSTTPRPVEVEKAKGTMFVWPIAPTPGAQLAAAVWCKTLNRQRRVEGDGNRARVRCHLDADPRRAANTVRVSGVPDAAALLQRRLQRLEDGTDDALIERQRRIVLANDRVALRTPLSLARRLSEHPGPATTTAQRHAVAARAGHGALLAAEAGPMRFGPEYGLANAVVVVPTDAPTKAEAP